MKIALASQFSNDKKEENFELIIRIIVELKGQVDLICFGEAFLQGFDALCWDYKKDEEIAINLRSKYLTDIKTAAKEHKISVSFGFYEVFEESIYSSYIVIDHSGEILHHYRRVSIGWKEVTKCDGHYKEGKAFSTFEFMGRNILVAVCGDLWHEKNIDAINNIEKDIILWPLHIDYSIEQWETSLNDYLIQTSKLKQPVLMINNLSKTSYGGCYYFKGGKIIKELTMENTGFLIFDI